MGDPGIHIHPWEFMGKLGGPYKTLKAEVEFQPSFALSYTVLGSPLTPVERQDTGATKRFVFRNIPAAEFPPYSLYSLAPLPVYVLWQRPWALSATGFVGVDGFWDEAGQMFYRRYFKDLVKSGPAFKAFAAELLQGLPEPPQARAAAIQQRLDRRVRNTRYPTFEEKARETHEEASKSRDDHDLDEIVKLGRADGQGMALLYLALLGEAGIHPTLAMVRDRWFALFNYDLTDPYQAHHQIFGISEAGKPMLWVDPTLRFAQPGMVQPAFQGTAALFLDTTTWKASRGQIPIQTVVQNASAYAFEMNLGDEADRFTVQAGFQGWDEWLERRDYQALEPSEEARKLRRAFEKGVAQCAVIDAKVKNAQSPDARLTWSVEGSVEHAPSLPRSLDPFPGMASPLYLPEAWPDRRREPILFDRLLTGTAAEDGSVSAKARIQEQGDGLGLRAWALGKGREGLKDRLKATLFRFPSTGEFEVTASADPLDLDQPFTVEITARIPDGFTRRGRSMSLVPWGLPLPARSIQKAGHPRRFPVHIRGRLAWDLLAEWELPGGIQPALPAFSETDPFRSLTWSARIQDRKASLAFHEETRDADFPMDRREEGVQAWRKDQYLMDRIQGQGFSFLSAAAGP